MNANKPFIVIGLLGIVSIFNIRAQELEQKALSLAIERNVSVRNFQHQSCSFFGYHMLKSSVILIPINKEILDAAIAYKAKSEKMSEQDAEKLRTQNYETYITGNTAAFVLFVVVSVDAGAVDDRYDEVYFNGFSNNVNLQDESQKYQLEKYTRVFDAPLSPGWNKGYLYFQNFRKEQNFSYSLHFSNFIVNACKGNGSSTPLSGSWAMSFDESQIGFLSLLQKGLDENSIRKQYGITSYSTAQLNGSDILNLISTVVGLLTFIK